MTPPPCCNGATVFIATAGIAELRNSHPDLEGALLGHIVYTMGIPGAAAGRLLESLDRNAGPAVHLFRCPRCGEYQFHIDHP